MHVLMATHYFSRLHFIPLSMSYDEIYNIHAYFSGPSNSMMKAANVTLSPKLRQAENIFPEGTPYGAVFALGWARGHHLSGYRFFAVMFK